MKYLIAFCFLCFSSSYAFTQIDDLEFRLYMKGYAVNPFVDAINDQGKNKFMFSGVGVGAQFRAGFLYGDLSFHQLNFKDADKESYSFSSTLDDGGGAIELQLGVKILADSPVRIAGGVQGLYFWNASTTNTQYPGKLFVNSNLGFGYHLSIEGNFDTWMIGLEFAA